MLVLTVSFTYCVLFEGCSTDKDTLINRQYHTLTAHFNVFFNGNESFNLGVSAINDKYKENYDEILPIYRYGDDKVLAPGKTYMETAQKKATKTIQKHEIRVSAATTKKQSRDKEKKAKEKLKKDKEKNSKKKNPSQEKIKLKEHQNQIKVPHQMVKRKKKIKQVHQKRQKTEIYL